MPTTSRNRYLQELAEEYLEAGIGREHLREIYDQMLADGHVTIDEMASRYGYSGFQRDVIRPVVKSRDSAGRDKYITTKSGGAVQMEFAELDDVAHTYWWRKHHIEASVERLAMLRQQIIDTHGVDPESLPDPFDRDPGEDDEPEAA